MELLLLLQLPVLLGGAAAEAAVAAGVAASVAAGVAASVAAGVAASAAAAAGAAAFAAAWSLLARASAASLARAFCLIFPEKGDGLLSVKICAKSCSHAWHIHMCNP